MTAILAAALMTVKGPHHGQVAKARAAAALHRVAGEDIGHGSAPRLLKLLGPGESVVRPDEVHDDGWTFWRVRGRSEWITVYWEPANPAENRRVTRITLDRATQIPSSRRAKTVDAGKLGPWGQIPLGISRNRMIDYMKPLGPGTRDGEALTWRNRNLRITAEFSKGRLDSIDIDGE